VVSAMTRASGYAKPARSPRKERALELFAGLPREYDWMGPLLSFGQDPRWRRAMVGLLGVTPADRVIDVAAGTGLVSAAIVRRYGCQVVAVDQSEQMLSAARRRFARDPRLASRTQAVTAEAERLPFGDGEFDGLTVGYLFRYVDDPAATIRELARVVKPGATIASLEFFVPPSAVPRALWRAYTRFALPAIGRVSSKEWADVGRFLAWNIREHYARYPLAELCGQWRAAGIGSVSARVMSFGAGVVMSGRREPS
jgi:demethylmenaquinone methyltransferase/2-methoxy-6-polyprenyl-1,4-benzoquinol methylase